MISLEHLLIESDRLWLRPIEMKDAQVIYENFTQAITTYMYPSPNANLLETEGFVRFCILNRRKQEEMVMTILLKESFEFIGLVGIHQLRTQTPEIGIWIKEQAFHHKYGLEAVSALIEVFDELMQVEHYVYPVDSRNTPSQKIPLALGGHIASHYTQLNKASKTLEIDEYWIPPHKENS